MNKIDTVISYISQYIHREDEKEFRYMVLAHMTGVAQFAAMLALKRGLNPQLMTVAGLLHDIYTLETCDMESHAKKGAVEARIILDELGVTTHPETDIICDAIFNHSKKDKIHGEYAEALKDADVLQHCLFNASYLPSAKDEERFYKLIDELGLENPHGKN
jgi:putative nucleotidyltransferase with HDIG domain